MARLVQIWSVCLIVAATSGCMTGPAGATQQAGCGDMGYGDLAGSHTSCGDPNCTVPGCGAATDTKSGPSAAVTSSCGCGSESCGQGGGCSSNCGAKGMCGPGSPCANGLPCGPGCGGTAGTNAGACASGNCGPVRAQYQRFDDDRYKDCSHQSGAVLPAVHSVPRELNKVSLPAHTVEPPDVLLIEAVDHLRPEYDRLRSGDVLVVQVGNTVPLLPDESRVDQMLKVINGLYTIDVDGYIDFGPNYGKVLVVGLTVNEVHDRVEAHLKRAKLKQPKVYVAPTNRRTRQLVSGQHLVRPDGTVNLGIYGSVYVSGMTLDQVRLQIENHLAQHIHEPKVSVDVLAYNSKFYYVIADGGGAGEQVIKLPCTGTETVLDAVANVRGLPTVANKGEIWVARPAPAGAGVDQILRVDWNAIARGGATDTNYQLLPGDRLYVKADNMIVFDTWIAKFTAPWERLFGFTLLGNGTVRALQRGRSAAGGFGGGGGFGF